MYIYIAYRNLPQYFRENAGCGGTPVNNDYRFTNVKDDIYLLTFPGANYAVSKEAAKKFIQDVLDKCTEKNQGFFPLVPSLNGKETAAVVEVREEHERPCYYNMDDEVLYQMLEELREGSGDPLSPRDLMNYCYPNPELPEGDFTLDKIYHGIYCKPDNTPVSVIKPFTSDKKISYFGMNEGRPFVRMREGDSEVKYQIPKELIPEIKEKVRELCKEPAEAYVEPGQWEGYIRFDDDSKRIFTDPDKTLELLKDIASKGTFESKEELDMSKYQPVGKYQGMTGIGMMGLTGFMGMSAYAQPVNPIPKEPAADGTKCIYCGADVSGKRFCTECGGKVGS